MEVGLSLGNVRSYYSVMHKYLIFGIDGLVADGSIEKVDMIKMDIEGAELSALYGAENTIKRFRPKLAISLYHKPEDFFEIPLYLNSLGLGYEFNIDHHSIHNEETVLYAR